MAHVAKSVHAGCTMTLERWWVEVEPDLRCRCAKSLPLVLASVLVTACGDDAGAGGGSTGTRTSVSTSASEASSSTGRPSQSEVHARLVCNEGVIQIDCTGAQVTHRRADLDALAFDCDAFTGHIMALVYSPKRGNSSSWGGGTRLIEAFCPSSNQSEFVNPDRPGHTIDMIVYEPDTYMEGTFNNADGTLEGSFAIFDN